MPENIDPKNVEVVKCHNCIRLQNQLISVQQSISKDLGKAKEGEVGDCGVMGQISELRGKFVALKKKLEVVEKENDQLFEQNSRKGKEISKLKRLLE